MTEAPEVPRRNAMPAHANQYPCSFSSRSSLLTVNDAPFLGRAHIRSIPRSLDGKPPRWTRSAPIATPAPPPTGPSQGSFYLVNGDQPLSTPFQPRGASGHPWSNITGDPSRGPSSSQAIPRSEPSSSLGVLAAEGHAGTRCACDQDPFLIGYIALDHSHSATLFDHPADSEQTSLPDRLQEVDLEFERREGFTFAKIR